MATQNSLCTKKSAFKKAMNLQSFKCVLRTSGFKPASRRQKWRDTRLIKSDYYYKRENDNFLEHIFLTATANFQQRLKTVTEHCD
jgi:aspartyl aminopeptidase